MNRWIKIVAICLAIGAVGSGAILGYRHYANAQAINDADRAIAELVQREPNLWTFDGLEACRQTLPDKDNGSIVLQSALRLLPEKGTPYPAMEWMERTLPPSLLEESYARDLSAETVRAEPVLSIARQLVHYPSGRFPPLQIASNPLLTSVEERQAIRTIFMFLRADAFRSSHAGDCEKAWDCALAILHTARSIGDEPNTLCQLIRMAGQTLTVRTLERILGQGEVNSSKLTAMRAFLKQERGVNLSETCARGERATFHLLFSKWESGELTWAQTCTDAGLPIESIRAGFIPDVRMLKESHAYVARFLTDALEKLAKSDAERHKAMNHWEEILLHERSINAAPLLATLLMPAMRKIANAELRNDTLLDCAAASLAAEEFRKVNNRWPKSLDELASAKLLDEVPTDWYDRKPLRLRHSNDGMVIFSSAFRTDYQGDALDNLETYDHSERTEFRLWNPDRRRQPVR